MIVVEDENENENDPGKSRRTAGRSELPDSVLVLAPVFVLVVDFAFVLVDDWFAGAAGGEVRYANLGGAMGQRGLAVELGGFPLVRVGSPGGRAWSAADVESFFACADRAISHRARFVLLHDARGMPRLDDAQQRHFLAELAQRKPLIERFLIAYGAVVQSPLERGVLTALSWSTPLALPRRIFASEPEARSFLLDAYARFGPRKRRSGEYRIKAG